MLRIEIVYKNKRKKCLAKDITKGDLFRIKAAHFEPANKHKTRRKHTSGQIRSERYE